MKKIIFILCILLVTVNAYAGEWVNTGEFYMYKKDDGDFAMDEQINIDGKYYYFDDYGYMLTGYQQVNGEFYIFNQDGTPKTENFTYNNKVYHVSERGKIRNITEEEFDQIVENNFAANSYNADTELNYQLDIGKKYIELLPISKNELVRLLIKTLGDKYTTDKFDYVMKNIVVNWKEKAFECAKEYLIVRNALKLPVNREQLKDILKNIETFEDNEANYGVEMAYNSLGAIDDEEIKKAIPMEIRELIAAYDNEITFKALGTGESILNKNINNNMTVQEKRQQLANRIAKAFMQVVNGTTYSEMKQIILSLGVGEKITTTALTNISVDWDLEGYKLCKRIMVKNPYIELKELRNELIGRGLNSDKADEISNALWVNPTLINYEEYSDVEIIKVLKDVGFDDNECNELLTNLKFGPDVSEFQIVEKKSEKSNNTIVAPKKVVPESNDN